MQTSRETCRRTLDSQLAPQMATLIDGVAPVPRECATDTSGHASLTAGPAQTHQAASLGKGVSSVARYASMKHTWVRGSRFLTSTRCRCHTVTADR